MPSRVCGLARKLSGRTKSTSSVSIMTPSGEAHHERLRRRPVARRADHWPGRSVRPRRRVRRGAGRARGSPRPSREKAHPADPLGSLRGPRLRPDAPAFSTPRSPLGKLEARARPDEVHGRPSSCMSRRIVAREHPSACARASSVSRGAGDDGAGASCATSARAAPRSAAASIARATARVPRPGRSRRPLGGTELTRTRVRRAHGECDRQLEKDEPLRVVGIADVVFLI